MTARRIAIVPHTHWDREWYKSYQDFRLGLVELIDTLLPLLERDASYPHFMLDGQMAVVDDYLEVRPEAEGRLRALAASGRISMGPWYILMDEFLASGETIVRNLQMGLGRGAAFGGVMELGYLPDMFGHIAQMPQILRLAGFHDAVVWRGVPSQVTKNAFLWESPDGSSVRAEYLPVGYGNGAALPDDAKALIRRTSDNVAEVADFLMGDLLCMNGSDHLMPQPWLGRVVAEANDLQDDFDFEVTSLPRYLANAPTEGLTTVAGELRSGARANMLMGVTSNRVDVKRRGAAGRTGARAPGRAVGGAVPGPGRSTRTACWSWPGSRWCATPPTIRSAPAPSTTSSTPSSIATPRRGPSEKGWPPGPSRASPARWPTPARPSSIPHRGRAPGSWSSSCGRTVRHPPACRSCPSDPGCPVRWCSMPTRCARCSGCCRGRASATTRGSTTC